MPDRNRVPEPTTINRGGTADRPAVACGDDESVIWDSRGMEPVSHEQWLGSGARPGNDAGVVVRGSMGIEGGDCPATEVPLRGHAEPPVGRLDTVRLGPGAAVSAALA